MVEVHYQVVQAKCTIGTPHIPYISTPWFPRLLIHTQEMRRTNS